MPMDDARQIGSSSAQEIVRHFENQWETTVSSFSSRLGIKKSETFFPFMLWTRWRLEGLDV